MYNRKRISSLDDTMIYIFICTTNYLDFKTFTNQGNKLYGHIFSQFLFSFCPISTNVMNETKLVAKLYNLNF